MALRGWKYDLNRFAGVTVLLLCLLWCHSATAADQPDQPNSQPFVSIQTVELSGPSVPGTGRVLELPVHEHRSERKLIELKAVARFEVPQAMASSENALYLLPPTEN